MELEENKDPRLRNKGRFGMDTRTVWFVVETKEDQEQLSAEYPGLFFFVRPQLRP